jgi:hypothetical protein
MMILSSILKLKEAFFAEKSVTYLHVVTTHKFIKRRGISLIWNWMYMTAKQGAGGFSCVRNSE